MAIYYWNSWGMRMIDRIITIMILLLCCIFLNGCGGGYQCKEGTYNNESDSCMLDIVEKHIEGNTTIYGWQIVSLQEFIEEVETATTKSHCVYEETAWANVTDFSTSNDNLKIMWDKMGGDYMVWISNEQDMAQNVYFKVSLQYQRQRPIWDNGCYSNCKAEIKKIGEWRGDKK